MDNNVILIICAILAVITVVVYTFASAAIYKRTRAKNNPYYFCESDWTCCTAANPDCDTGLKNFGITRSDETYAPSDNIAPGSLYYQNCVLPIQNGILRSAAGENGSPDFSYLYSTTSTDPAPTGTVSPYYPGCNSYGNDSDENINPIAPTTLAMCKDPTLNPQNEIKYGVCPYASLDSYPTEIASSGLPKGARNVNDSRTINSSNWFGNLNSQYIAGLGTSGNPSINGYVSPYNVPGGTPAGKQTFGLNKSNMLYPSGAPPT